jgi:hypothetical protein
VLIALPATPTGRVSACVLPIVAADGVIRASGEKMIMGTVAAASVRRRDSFGADQHLKVKNRTDWVHQGTT